MAIVLFILLGVLAGFLAGLLGVGGGLVIIPALFYIFQMLGFPQENLMQIAIGTTLASMIFNMLAAAISHHLHNNVLWEVVKKTGLGLVAGSVVGAFLAHLLSTSALKLIFAVFVALFGVYYLRQKKQREGSYPLPSSRTLKFLGLGVGTVSNILGIGGGTIMVPIFVAFKIPMKKAIGTSTAAGVIITTIGAIAYLLFGYKETHIPLTFGYIYFPAFGCIALTSFFAAPIGAHLIRKISISLLRRCFAWGLIVVGLMMLV